MTLINWGPDYADPDTNVTPFTDFKAKSIAFRNAWDDPAIAAKAKAAALMTDPTARAAAYKDITEYVLHNGPYADPVPAVPAVRHPLQRSRASPGTRWATPTSGRSASRVRAFPVKFNGVGRQHGRHAPHLPVSRWPLPMALLSFLLRRLVGFAAVMVGVSIITFALSHVVPTDPAVAALGDHATDAQIDAFREQYGLNKPVPEQYWIYVTNLVQGDLGTSLRTRRPVAADLRDFFPATFELSLTALVFSILIGVPAGVASAVARNRLPDHVVRVVSLIGGSLPIFWLGPGADRLLLWAPGLAAGWRAHR